jgi:hypothetical protein
MVCATSLTEPASTTRVSGAIFPGASGRENLGLVSPRCGHRHDVGVVVPKPELSRKFGPEITEVGHPGRIGGNDWKLATDIWKNK